MSAPSFVTHTATAFNNATTPKTASVAVNAGDLLVAMMVSADFSTTGATPTNNGAALTWTQRQVNSTSGNVWNAMWTAVADTARTIIVTFALGAGTTNWGGDVQVWRTALVGTSTKVTGGSGAPTLNITTTAANSAIAVAIGDWAAVAGAPTWRTNAGTFTSTFELAGDATTYSARGGYHADAGAIGTYAVGVTAPTGETYSIIALEIQGSVVAALEQEGYRFRHDDGSETTATFMAAQDTPATLAPSVTKRLRVLVNATGDPASQSFTLQYRKVGAASWRNADTFV